MKPMTERRLSEIQEWLLNQVRVCCDSTRNSEIENSARFRGKLDVTEDEITCSIESWVYDTQDNRKDQTVVVWHSSLFGHWIPWCKKMNQQEFPVNDAVLSAYIDDKFQELSLSTIRIHLSTLSMLQRVLLWPIDLWSEKLRNHCNRLTSPTQALGDIQKSARTVPLRFETIHVIGEKVRTDPETSMRDLQAFAAMTLAYDVRLKPGQLVDISMDQLVKAPEKWELIIHVPGYGPGKAAWPLTRYTRDVLTHWLKCAEIDAGMLFRGVLKSGRLTESIGRQPLVIAMRELAYWAGVDQPIAGGSMRAGREYDDRYPNHPVQVNRLNGIAGGKDAEDMLRSHLAMRKVLQRDIRLFKEVVRMRARELD